MEKKKKRKLYHYAFPILGLFAFVSLATMPASQVTGATTWTASGVKTAQYQLSGATTLAWTNISIATVTGASGFDLPITKVGVTYITVSTQDNAGNTAMKLKAVKVGTDGTVTPAPIQKIEYKLSGASTQDWTLYDKPFKITKEGKTTITVRVYDEAGNSTEIERLVKLDKSAPINNGLTITLD